MMPGKKQGDVLKHYNQALKHIAKGKDDQAISCLETCLELDNHFVDAYAALGEIFDRRGDLMPGIECYASAIQLQPDNVRHKQKFIGLIEQTELQQENPPLKDLVLECLREPGLDFSQTDRIWHNILSLDSGFRSGDSMERLLDPFFLLGLQRLVVCNVDFEIFLTKLRRELLLNENNKFIELVRALAVYCEATEYIFYVRPDEKKKIAELQALKNPSPYQQALIDCYVPPHGIIVRDDIESITDISAGISSSVREQYEAFPYPRWRRIGDVSWAPELEKLLVPEKAQILVAGCGTGREAIELAHIFPKGQVLAVDLSRASLSYAMTKAGEYGLQNITFRHGDILKLGSIGKTFDFIASSGVLHHMEDPLKGWSILTGLLKKGGAMRIALYSRTAHRNLTETKKIIADKKYASDNDGIRQFRHDAPAILPADIYKHVCSFHDYYFTSECRDLLFHVQEHEYDLLELRDMLKTLKLNFLSFYLHRDILKKYKARFPGVRDSLNLETWHEFEQSEPDAFKEMYKFLCRKA